MKQRKIKFRVWDVKAKNWLTPEQFYHYDILKLDSEIYILQEFIGLIDKNNKEIYEGDLINFTVDGITHGPETEYEKNAEVWYSEEDAQFVFGYFKDGNNSYDWWYSMADRISDIEVVGNIFQTKKDYVKKSN